MADDRELRISITTDAELAAMQKLRKEYAGMIRDTEKGTDTFKDLTAELEKVDEALESNTAKILARRKELEAMMEAQVKAGVDVSATAEEYDKLGESAQAAGVDMSTMANSAQIIGTLLGDSSKATQQATNSNKAFGLSNRQLLRSLSGLLKATPLVSLAMRALAGPVGIAMAGFMALSMAVSKFRASSQKAEEEAKKLAETLEKPTVDAYKASSAASALAAAETAKMTDRLREQSEYFPTLAEEMALYREEVKLMAEERAADLKQAHDRELSELELLHQQKLISEDEYYKRSQALSLQAARQKAQAELEDLQRQIDEKTEAIARANKRAEAAGVGLEAKRELLLQLTTREAGRVTTTEDLRAQVGQLLGKGAGSIYALQSAALTSAQAAARAKETDPTTFFAKRFQKRADDAAAALRKAQTDLDQKKQEISDRERDDRLKASTAADIARQVKRVTGEEDEADKITRERQALQDVMPVRKEALRLQVARTEAAINQAQQMRLMQQNPAAMAMAREATGIMLGGRATGAQMAAVSVLGSPQALLAGGGSSRAMMAFAGGFVTRRQSLVSELNNPHTTPQRKTQIQKELDKLDAAAGVVGRSGAWTEDLARRLPGFSIGGYTGDGPKNEIAGVVHKGEIVIPADVVKRMPRYENSNMEPAPAWYNSTLAQKAAGTAAGGAGIKAVTYGWGNRGKIAKGFRILRGALNSIGRTTPSIVSDTYKGLSRSPFASGAEKAGIEATESAWTKLAGKASNIADIPAGKGFKIEHLIEAIRKGRKVVLTTAEGEIVHGLENLKGAPNHIIRSVLKGLGMPDSEAAHAAQQIASKVGGRVAPSSLRTSGVGFLGAATQAAKSGLSWRTAAMNAGALSARVTARVAAGEALHYGLNKAAGMVNTEAVTNQSGTTLADETTGLGAVVGTGIDALAGYVEHGPAGAIARAGLGLAKNTTAGISGWSSAWDAAHASKMAADSDTRLQDQDLRKYQAEVDRKSANERRAHEIFKQQERERKAKLDAEHDAKVRAAEEHSRSVIANSYLFGTGGGQEGANYRADEAARRRASNPMADALRLRDARAGNTTGLEGPAAAAFYAQKMMEVMQAMSVTQSDADSRTKTARGAF